MEPNLIQALGKHLQLKAEYKKNYTFFGFFISKDKNIWFWTLITLIFDVSDLEFLR